MYPICFVFWDVNPHVCCPVIVTGVSGVGGGCAHYEDGRRCHSGMVFVAMQAFSCTLLSLSLLMLLLQWPFQEAVELLRPKGRKAKWKMGDIGIQEVNMSCIISTFTDNWEHTVWLPCLMKSLWRCVRPQYKSKQLQKESVPRADLLFPKNICMVNGVTPTILQNQAWRKVRTQGTILTFMRLDALHKLSAGHEP